MTSSRRRDEVLFVSILVLMLLLSPRLSVYHTVSVIEVSVERITPDGKKIALQTPERFTRPGNGRWPGESVMRRLSPQIDAYMSQSDWARTAPPGTRFVWTVRWADDSLQLDRAGRIIWEVPVDSRR